MIKGAQPTATNGKILSLLWSCIYMTMATSNSISALHTTHYFIYVLDLFVCIEYGVVLVFHALGLS